MYFIKLWNIVAIKLIKIITKWSYRNNASIKFIEIIRNCIYKIDLNNLEKIS